MSAALRYLQNYLISCYDKFIKAYSISCQNELFVFLCIHFFSHSFTCIKFNWNWPNVPKLMRRMVQGKELTNKWQKHITLRRKAKNAILLDIYHLQDKLLPSRLPICIRHLLNQTTLLVTTLDTIPLEVATKVLKAKAVKNWFQKTGMETSDLLLLQYMESGLSWHLIQARAV